jgi:hypothetical protein
MELLTPVSTTRTGATSLGSGMGQPSVLPTVTETWDFEIVAGTIREKTSYAIKIYLTNYALHIACVCPPVLPDSRTSCNGSQLRFQIPVDGD